MDYNTENFYLICVFVALACYADRRLAIYAGRSRKNSASPRDLADGLTGMEEKPRYCSFILRVLLAGDGGRPQWRASLEDTSTGERRGFASLEDLYGFLKLKTGLEAGQERGPT